MELVAIFSDDRDEALAHYGVKGMHWGVWNAETARKHAGSKGPEHYSTKTKNGETLTLRRNKGARAARVLRAIPSVKKLSEKTYNYDMLVNGKRVGDFQMYRKPNGEMNITWGSTKRKHRNKGYMQAAIKLGEQIARNYGATKMTAELVGKSPDIHTVAKKAGFEITGKSTDKALEDTWGGLTYVEKKLK